MAEEAPDGAVEKWWRWIRPYWHVVSFFVLITYMATIKWSDVQAYGKDIAQHDQRISSMESWRNTVAPNIAAMRQEVHDIHEQIMHRK